MCKNIGNNKIQNYFLIKRLKKIKFHFINNKKDLKCKIIISKIISKIKKNINFIKKNI
ncbi:hypothetical protein [Candidatus Carsonella ruddii]|uniref:Ribosomal protein S15 n=1 Tax=Candidatus Carsonella ruddii HC isolate Thao2000 TaxID=1202538 RepID=J3TW42_CARRU|nr:hypothetical protein [Candidatus Carsonella ruddii]AFP83935.1 ribosomal protein S15 [Candidatus Carsonella ruddii HC isolate Thao2000]